MRTTIHLPDELLTRAKRAAVESNRTLTSVIEEALRSALSRKSQGPAERVDLPTYGSGGLQPGIDLDDSANLFDLLERPNAAD